MSATSPVPPTGEPHQREQGRRSHRRTTNSEAATIDDNNNSGKLLDTFAPLFSGEPQGSGISYYDRSRQIHPEVLEISMWRVELEVQGMKSHHGRETIDDEFI
uniref:Uncharacterized protein n=1 Tax=Solanum tuberosum TaxID=4113 RepID=M1E097_SOLTU